jgi:hypothetical protein
MLDRLIASDRGDARALNSRAVLYARRRDAAHAEADVAAALELDQQPLSTLQAACTFSQLSLVSETYRDRALQLLA